MRTIENCFKPSVFNYIKNHIFDKSTPWHFIETTFNDSLEESIDKKYSWVHTIANNEIPTSHLFNVVYPEIVNLLVRNKEKFNKIIRIRVGLITATGTHHINDPHVDLEIFHKVGLIYLNTSNAPTYIYKEKYDPESKIGVLEYMSKQFNNRLTTEWESHSVENRAVLFDGMHYHSSSTPTDIPRRIVINFNYY